MSTTYSNQPGIHLHQKRSVTRPRQMPKSLKQQLEQSNQTFSDISNDLDHAYCQYTLQKTKEHPTTHNEVPEGTLYLFNVIVALEWSPTEAYRSQLQQAFRSASDFLYDVSDGQMAFGHVLFGGPELMPYADIQMMASNRLHPRSWKQGLFSEQGRPIRVGRGLWNDDLNVTMGWDDPEGYRTLIHEWGHYALGLDDEYTDTVEIEYHNSKQKVVLPSYNGTKPSFMTSIIWSEMLEEKHPAILKTIRSHYQEFEPRTLAGPYDLPLPFPQFHFCIESASPQDDDTGSWLYLLGKSKDNAIGFDKLLALGTLEHSSIYQALELLNINLTDHSVQVIKMKNQEHDIMTTIVPLSSDQVKVSIKHNSGPAPRKLQLFSQGNSSREHVIEINLTEGQSQWSSEPIKVPTLDGHLLLELTTGQLMIYPFGQGGAGPGHNGVSSPPHTAGSADGNVMIFFGEAEGDSSSNSTEEHNDLKLITTRTHASSGNEHIGSDIYSLASNQRLPEEHNPTLVLYYDIASNGPASGYKHKPILRRLVNGIWEPLKETYAPYGRPFVAIPLNKETAFNLTDDCPKRKNHERIESYQLYWEPMDKYSKGMSKGQLS